MWVVYFLAAMYKDNCCDPAQLSSKSSFKVIITTNMQLPISLLTLAACITAVSAVHCKCTKVKNEGLYCGYCDQVLNLGTNGNLYDVFWCNKQVICINMSIKDGDC